MVLDNAVICLRRAWLQHAVNVSWQLAWKLGVQRFSSWTL
jgi:hypothetical protein